MNICFMEREEKNNARKRRTKQESNIQRNNFGTLSWVDEWWFKWKMGPKIFQIEICEMLFCFGGNGGSML